MSVEILKTPNFSNLRRWSNNNDNFVKNLAATSNFGNKLKNDIDLLSKKSKSKKKRKLKLINDIDEEENKINDKFYDDFLNTLNSGEFKLKTNETKSDKKKFKIHQVQKKISAKLLNLYKNKYHNNIIGEFSPEKNIIKRNNHHLKTTFEADLKVENNKKMNDSIKKYENENFKLNEDNNSNNSDIKNIENLQSLDYKNKNFKINEIIKEENIEHEIDINSNNIKNNKKDYIISDNIKKISNISKTGNKLENINTKQSSENKEFLVNVKKKKKYFCCIPIY